MGKLITSKTRIIYDADFYKMQAIFLSNKFSKLIQSINEEYLERGIKLTIPLKGFGTVKKYHEWVGDLHDHEISESEIFSRILEEFNLNKKNKEYRLRLQSKLITGVNETPSREAVSLEIKNEYIPDPNAPEEIRHKYSIPKPIEIYIKVHPWTRKEDIDDTFWQRVKSVQQQLDDYKERNKFADNFERNFKIYQLFLTLDEAIKEKDPSILKMKKDHGIQGRSALHLIKSHPDFLLLQKEYKFSDSMDIEPIIYEFKSMLKDLNFSYL